MGTNRRTGVIGTTVACIVMAWLFSATPADACSCMALVPACQGAWLADAVFVGRVVDSTSVPNENGPRHVFLRSRRVTLEVLEQFRGESLLVPRDGATGVEVFTGSGDADCGISFKTGESYLVFATIGKGEPTVLQTGICNRTREISRAQEDLPYLRTLTTSSPTSPPRGGRVYGRLELFDPQLVRPPGAAEAKPQRLASVPVTLTEEGGSLVTKTLSTDASGQYEFTDLAPGKYRVEASLPDIYYSISTNPAAFFGELRDIRGCSEMNLRVAHDGRVSGRIIDARGMPVANLTVTLLDANDPDSPYQRTMFMKVLTNRDGLYKLTKVAPGRYLAAVNAERDPMTRQLLKRRVLHPGVERTGDATRIDVGPGERVKLPDWSMPPP